MRLSDIEPKIDAARLAERFVPPSRFDSVRFANYEPDPAHASQTAARNALETFSQQIAAHVTGKRKWWPRPAAPAGKRAIYLDGGFGVGKTHLLASLWHEAPRPKAYLSFGELTAYIGFAGMGGAVEIFRHNRLVCVDEFELDDVANTLMVVTFLRNLLDGGHTHLAVTSNTLPDRLGEQRFSASEFRREIAAISSHFDELKIDGDDYRTRAGQPHLTVDIEGRSTVDDFDSLVEHLKTVHPVHYGALLDGIEHVSISGLHEISDQDEALLFVQLVDKLYDARIPVHISGCAPSALFSASYRNGGYRKKYGRAESRLMAMHTESGD